MSFFYGLLGRNRDTDEPTTSVRSQPEADPAADSDKMPTAAPANEPESIDTVVDPSLGKADTRDLGDLTNTATKATSHSAPRPPGMRVGYTSDVGQLRDHNEDSLIAFQGVQLDVDASGPFGFYVVTDGMGGHNAGEVASSLAARLVSREVLRHIYLPYLLDDAPHADMVPIIEILTDAVQKANDLVHQEVPGGGTTLTCALILGQRAYIAHVGDSRAYLLTDNEMTQITQDHSFVGRLMELGELSPEEAAVHPQRHILYRAIGQGENLDIDTHHQAIPLGGRLLLCSDGLSGSVPDEEIMRIAVSAATPQDACQRLVDAANDAGGPDNITAVIIETPQE